MKTVPITVALLLASYVGSYVGMTDGPYGVFGESLLRNVPSEAAARAFYPLARLEATWRGRPFILLWPANPHARAICYSAEPLW